ncbi:MAG: hypothetical protein AAF492_28505, partial [Verrucomicrobiota bacterium]
KDIKEQVDMLFIDCGFNNYLACFQGIESRLNDGAIIISDNAGMGASSMKTFLKIMREEHESKTEWYDVDLPWGKRDAMEITTYRKKK